MKRLRLFSLLFIVLLALFIVNSGDVSFAQDDNPGIVPTNTPGGPTGGSSPTKNPGGSDELLISYDPAATPAQIAGMLARIGGVEKGRIPAIGVMLVKVPGQYANPSAVRSAFASNAAFGKAHGSRQIVEKNAIYRAFYTPNDGVLLASQDYLTAIKAHTISPTIGGWDLNPTRGTGVTIAIVDSGVFTTHPDLSLNMVAGYDFVDNDTIPLDTQGHGTLVAGIAAARGNNLIGIAGVAFNAKIMPIRVLVVDPAPPCFNDLCGNALDIGKGIIYAADKGAKVINLSFGSTEYSATVEAAIQYAISKGAVVIAAAGSDSGTGTSMITTPIYPASLPSVISVGSVNDAGTPTRSTFSNFGKIDIVAPGEGNLSTCMPGDLTCNTTTTRYLSKSGTSFAAPIVSGVAALVLSQKVATTPAQVKEALICGALNLGAASDYGAGLVQANLSLNWNNDSNTCYVTLANDDVRKAFVVGAMPYKSTQAITGRNATVAADDPDDTCNAATEQQSVWYKFAPTTSGRFQISTMGSNYNTSVAIYKGDPGSLVQIGCNDEYGAGISQSVLAADLQAAQAYHIKVTTASGTVVTDKVLEFRVNPVIIATTRVENGATNIAYTGTWATVAITGQSGTVARTTDNSAFMSFTIRSWGLIIARTTGPDKGEFYVFVDGANVATINNRTPVTKFQQQTMGPGNVLNFSTLATRRIVIVRVDGSFAGPIDIDWVQGINSPLGAMTNVVGAVDERAASIKYSGAWTPLGPTPPQAGAFMGTLKQSVSTSAYAQFKFTGTAFTIHRTIGNLGSADIWVDGILIPASGEGYMDNTNPSSVTNVTSVPFAVNGLSSSDHIVTIAPYASSDLRLDKITVASPADLTNNLKVDERFAGVLYSGDWTSSTSPVVGANAGTTRTTTDANASVKFTFTGNLLLIGVRKSPTGADIRVFVDGIQYNGTTFDADSTQFEGLPLGVLTYAKHVVEIVPVIGAGESLVLDFFVGITHPTIKASQNLVPETSTAFAYFPAPPAPSAWTNKSATYLNGGAGKKTSTDGASILFTINGTGALIYTETSTASGYWEVYVDGVLYDADGSGPGDVFDMYSIVPSPRSAVIGLANLGVGTHDILLIANSTSPGDTLVFDGVRVFP